MPSQTSKYGYVTRKKCLWNRTWNKFSYNPDPLGLFTRWHTNNQIT